MEFHSCHKILTSDNVSSAKPAHSDNADVDAALNIFALGTRAIGRGRGDLLETSVIRQEDMLLDSVK